MTHSLLVWSFMFKPLTKPLARYNILENKLYLYHSGHSVVSISSNKVEISRYVFITPKANYLNRVKFWMGNLVN